MMDFFIQTFTDYAAGVLPWFALGVLVAYLVERRVSARDVSRFLGKAGWRRVWASFVLGMVSPLSIMPQLPISGSLVRLGAHPALLLGFLAAERSYDFQSFPIIAGFFGLKFAVLNALAIYVSLLAGFAVLRRSPVTFRRLDGDVSGNGFWKRQAKLFAVVLLGIAAAAAVRSLVPEESFAALAKTETGGLGVAMISGFALYFGTILGNYPVAKALSDLGMSATGVFTFLTVSPLFNGVVMALFASAARVRDVFRFFAVYTVTALAVSMVIGFFIL